MPSSSDTCFGRDVDVRAGMQKPLVRQKIEPKLIFATERTVVHWLHVGAVPRPGAGREGTRAGRGARAPAPRAPTCPQVLTAFGAGCFAVANGDAEAFSPGVRTKFTAAAFARVPRPLLHRRAVASGPAASGAGPGAGASVRASGRGASGGAVRAPGRRRVGGAVRAFAPPRRRVRAAAAAARAPPTVRPATPVSRTQALSIGAAGVNAFAIANNRWRLRRMRSREPTEWGDPRGPIVVGGLMIAVFAAALLVNLKRFAAGEI